MTAALVGIVLGLAIGGGCRWFDVPLPAPPKLVGALLVVAMTLGFLGTDLAIGRSAEFFPQTEATR
jgi:XapX domain-containing protein